MAKGALSFDREFYRSDLSANLFMESEARKEYARLRRLANKRLAALERAGLGEAKVLRGFLAEFASLRGASERTVRNALEDVAHFVSLKTTTVRGIQAAQKKAIATMQSHGYDWINKSNIESFGRFMEAAKQHTYNKKAFDSERAAAYYKDYEEMILERQENMEDMMDDWEDLEDYEPEEPDETERVPHAPKREPAKSNKQPKQQPKKRRAKKEATPYERYQKRQSRRPDARSRKGGRKK